MSQETIESLNEKKERIKGYLSYLADRVEKMGGFDNIKKNDLVCYRKITTDIYVAWNALKDVLFEIRKKEDSNR